MQNRLICVEQNKGVYTPYNQQMYFKIQHEKIFNTPFEGYCTGISLAYIEEIIRFKNASVLPLPIHAPHFFNEEKKKRFFLTQNNCMHYQFKYERNPNEFSDIFMRDFCEVVLDEPIRLNPVERILDVMQENTIYLINLVFCMRRDVATELSDHCIVILHDGNYWRFFDPNYGEAKFKSRDHFNLWLKDEMTMGALRVFANPQQKKNGVLSIFSAKAVLYPYPQQKLAARSQREFVLRAKL